MASFPCRRRPPPSPPGSGSVHVLRSRRATAALFRADSGRRWARRHRRGTRTGLVSIRVVVLAKGRRDRRRRAPPTQQAGELLPQGAVLDRAIVRHSGIPHPDSLSAHGWARSAGGRRISQEGRRADSSRVAASGAAHERLPLERSRPGRRGGVSPVRRSARSLHGLDRVPVPAAGRGTRPRCRRALPRPVALRLRAMEDGSASAPETGWRPS